MFGWHSRGNVCGQGWVCVDVGLERLEFVVVFGRLGP